MRKLALSIGNAAYPECSLPNPVNDASDLADRLRELGFVVRVRTDATCQNMQEEVDAFGSDLARAEVGLFFFAGHGMQIEGKNYLTAIDTRFETEIQLKYSSLPLDYVIDILDRGGNQTSIVILG